MSSMASSRAALADTTAAVVNQPSVELLSNSLSPPALPATADSSPAKPRRRGWDKSRQSLPIWLPHSDSENQLLAADKIKAAGTTPHFQQLLSVAEAPADALSGAERQLSAHTSAVATLAEPTTGDAIAAVDQATDKADANALSAPPAAYAAPIPAASAHPAAQSGIPRPPAAPYHTRSRQQSTHNSTFSHSTTRSRAASPTPASAVPSLAAPAPVTSRRTASTAAAAVAPGRSSHAASAASLLSQAASIINKNSRTAPSTDATVAGRASKRTLSKKEDAGHKRRKSTETAEQADSATKADAVDASLTSKPPSAPGRQSVVGRPSTSSVSARSARQSLSMSQSAASSPPRSTPTKLRTYSRPSISTSPLKQPAASSIGTQTAAYTSSVESALQEQLAATSCSLSAAQQHSAALQLQLQAGELELSRLSNNQVALQSQMFQLTQQQQAARTESLAVKERLRCEEARSTARQLRVDECEAEVARLQQAVARLEAEAREAEGVRRRLHAYVEEMRGNIRVMVRVRPALPHESSGAGDAFAYTRDRDVHMLEVSGREERSVDGTTLQRKRQQFVFDHVFPPSATQAQLFEQVSSLTVSVLDGYDVLIFAYGQTGAGKSFSMEGPSLSTAAPASTASASSASGSAAPHHRHTPTSFSLHSDAQYEQRGLIQRSVEALFADVAQRRAKGWSFHLQVSVVELYNEAIRDLLVEHDTGRHEVRQVHRRLNSGESEWRQLGDARDDKVDVVVSNVHTVTVGAPLDVYPLLDRARQARASGATEANAHSSRSHLIVRLHVQASHAALQQRSDASLHLIDLAGSERVKASKAEGSRLKEAQHINRSLSALADVIQALSAGDKHVPYRNSRLTHMLQPYLAGSASKALMLVNLSPLDEHVSESLCSLRFAQTVSSCSGKRR